MRLLKYTPLLLFTSLCILLYLLLKPSQQETRSLDRLSFKTVRGEVLDIEVDEVYVVRFFSSWCVHCRKDYSELKEIAKKLNAKIIGIAVNDDLKNATSFVSTSILPYDYVVIDEDNKLKQLFKNRAVPETVVIEKGKIAYRKIGVIK